MNQKTVFGIVLGCAFLAGHPSYAMSPASNASAGTAIDASIPATIIGLTEGASSALQGAQASLKNLVKQVKQKPKVVKAKPKKKKKGPAVGAPEINAASGVQALALLIGVLLLGAERFRRYS